jgi:hypothetical protein
VDWIKLAQDTVDFFCEHIKETSDSIKGGKYLGQLSDCKRITYFASWS